MEVSPREEESTPRGRKDQHLIEEARKLLKEVKYDPDQWVEAIEWFSNITGVTEAEFIKMKADLIEETGDKYLLIKNYKTGKKYHAGKLILYSLEDLVCNVALHIDKPGRKNNEKAMKALMKIDKPEKKKEQTRYVPVEFINRSSPDDVKSVDVGYLQSLPEFQNAVFQVASNFNTIEGVSELQSPEVPSFTEFYYRDKTQGPAASMSAGAAAIVRVHAAFYEKDKNPNEWQQNHSQQIELLRNIEEYFPTHNGYVIYENGIHLEGYKKFPAPQSKPYYKVLLSGLIAYHRDVQVVTGHRWNPLPVPTETDDGKKKEEVPDTSLLERIQSDQRIDQVFTAAVNMKQGRTGPRNALAPNAIQKAKMLLELGYQGTYLTAAANGRKILVLTLIGGGAFGNEMTWIYEAIVQAHKRWGVEGMTTLTKVCVIMYGHVMGEECELESGLKALGVTVGWRNK